MSGRTRAGEERINLYKRRGVGVVERRKQLAAERREQRAERRTAAFTAHRGLDEKPAARSRQQRLEEWRKKRKDVPKTPKDKVKKPAFVVGKITYNDTYLYKSQESAVFQPPKGVVPVQESQPGRGGLRSQTRNLQKDSAQSVRDAINVFTAAMTSAPKRKIEKMPQTPKKKVASVWSTAKTPAKVSAAKARVKVEKSPDIVKQPLRIHSPAIQKVSEEVLKSNLKQQRPRKKSNKDISPPDGVSNVDETESKRSQENPNQIAVECAEKKCAKYFRSLYYESVTKLNRLCSEWTDPELQVPNEIGDEIDVAVGYAKLLISQKLQQFEDLIAEHESTNCSMDLKILISDLDGFWSMVNNQVEDIYRKFERLEILKVNNWQETSGNFKQLKPLPQKSKIIKTKGNVTSGLRSFLAQARKQARIGSDENNKSTISFAGVEMPRPMSPVIMRIASRAKQLGSPKISNSSDANRSPLRMIQPKGDEKIESPPKSAQKTPARKRTLLKTPGSAALRRSTRINTKTNEETSCSNFND